MNAVSDNDLELLESYLDEALPRAEAAELRHRMAADAALASAMTELRHERALCQKLWEANDPDDQAADRLIANIHSSIRKHELRRFATRSVRYGSAVAACLGIAILAGVLWHGRTPDSAKPQASAKILYQVSLVDDSGNVVAKQSFDSLEQARKLSDGLNRWQEHQERVRSGAVTPAGGDQF